MVSFDEKCAYAMSLAIEGAYRSLATGAIRRQGRGWYPSAQRVARELAQEFGFPVWKVTAIIAALSPRKMWAVNVRDARAILAHARDGKEMPTGCGLSANVEKAWRIATGDIRSAMQVLSGPKVIAFYRNIQGSTDDVTVDVWCARVAEFIDKIGPDEKFVAPVHSRYRRIADAYRIAAARCGETPRAMQAIVWIAVRGKADGNATFTGHYA